MRRRLLRSIGGVAALAVVALAVPLAVVVARSSHDEELLRLQRDALVVSRGLDLSAQRSDPIELPRSPDELGVYDARGRRVAGRGPQVADPVTTSVLRAGRPSDADDASGALIVAVPLLNGERVTGALRARRHGEGVFSDAAQAGVIIGGVAAAIIALALVAAVMLSRRLARPLEHVAVAARRLGDGDFSARAPRAQVPEVDEVAAALDRTAQRLGELVARERAFSADASHQLRTPLQALRLELEGLQLRLAGAPAPELDAALEQVDRLQETIQVLLALARDHPRGAQRCDVHDVLADVRERWHGPLAAVGRPLRVRERDGALVVQAGEGPVREIVDVLVANAEAHGAGTVTLTVARSEGWVSLTVADEGTGFGPDPEQAFTRRGVGAEGHGIGLALARALAHAEGGRLSVARSGAHPEVTLILPAGPSTSAG